MMQEECISIIIPVYQSIKSLKKCVESVLWQTYNNIQLILVDDGSTDGSGAICDSYAKKYDNVETIHISNSGPVVARKKGLQIARGQYIGFVDSDDYIEPTMFEKLYNAIKADDSDFVHSWYWSVHSGNRVCELNVYKALLDLPDERSRGNALKKLFLGFQYNITPSMWSKLYKKKFLVENYAYIPENINFGEDLLLLFVCVANSRRISVSDCCEYNYVIKDNSLSHLNAEEMFFKELHMLELLREINKKLNYPVNETELFEWIRERTVWLLSATTKKAAGVRGVQYYIKNIEKYREKKIVLYGLGMVGQDYLKQMERGGLNAPVALCDANCGDLFWGNLKVIKPVQLCDYDYDIILIAVLDEDCAKEIRRDLVSIGINDNCIIWEKPHR